MSISQNDIPKPIAIGKIEVSKEKQQKARKEAKTFAKELNRQRANKKEKAQLD